MPNTTLTLESVHSAIATNLGNSGIEVELAAADITQVLGDASRLYNRCRPQREIVAIPITIGQKKYGPYQTVWVGMVEVVDVQFVDGRIPGRVDPFDRLSIVSSALVGGGADGTTPGVVAQVLAANEDARRVASAEPEWKPLWSRDGTFHLYIDVRRDGLLCSVTYTWHVTPDDSVTTGMKFIPDGDTDWILNFSTARAKQILARIRGKFQGVTNPDGSVDPIDFAELAAEGREDEKDLKLEIEARRRPLPPAVE